MYVVIEEVNKWCQYLIHQFHIFTNKRSIKKNYFHKRYKPGKRNQVVDALTNDHYHPVPSLIDRLKGYYASNNKGMVLVQQSQAQERENH
jgi:hypothetical protein